LEETMNINPIQPLSSPIASTQSATAGAGAGQALDGFGTALMDAIQSLDRLQQEPAELGTQLAAGEAVELHDVMLAQDRASLGFQLAVQVRNKLVEAYQDVMRTQI
jgi:flagellar hook-basal body complex protein FliE